MLFSFRAQKTNICAVHYFVINLRKPDEINVNIRRQCHSIWSERFLHFLLF